MKHTFEQPSIPPTIHSKKGRRDGSDKCACACNSVGLISSKSEIKHTFIMAIAFTKVWLKFARTMRSTTLLVASSRRLPTKGESEEAAATISIDYYKGRTIHQLQKYFMH